MTLDDLQILIQKGEGTTLEFKESLSSSFARELVALANTIGGKILLGVRDDGTVVGVQDTNTLRARIQDIARNCDPPVQVLAEPVGGVFAVHVRESSAKPVQCSEGFFWRQGAVTQKLSRDEIRDLFRLEGVVRFDLAPCARFSYPEDFDREKFDAWLSLSGITGRPQVEDVLVNIEAAERADGAPLFRNAGALFFAKNVRRFFPQAYITCLLARGTDKVHILDRKDFDGGIVADIEDALRFVERDTRTAYRIEGLRRENLPEYPANALREAITNAVMHRDWFMEGANVFVEVYTDRVEVVSPGGLPRGLSLADLGSKSVRRAGNRGSHRGSSTSPRNGRRNDQAANPGIAWSQARGPLSQSVSIARPSGRADRDDRPGQATQQEPALSPDTGGGEFLRQTQEPQ